MTQLEQEAEEYAKQFDYAEDSSPMIDFISGAKSESSKDYWLNSKEFQSVIINKQIDLLHEFKYHSDHPEIFQERIYQLQKLLKELEQ